MKKMLLCLSIGTLPLLCSVPYCPSIEELMTHDSTFYCNDHDKHVLKLIIQNDCTSLLHHFKEKLPPLYIKCLQDFIITKNTLISVTETIDHDQIHNFLNKHKKRIGTFKFYGGIDMVQNINQTIFEYHGSTQIS